MRTKTLLLTAALAAAGIASSSAQSVYSVNAVGYINVTCKSGNTPIANQLFTTNNTVDKLFPLPVPEGSQIFTWNQSTLSFDVNTYSLDFGTGWDFPNNTLSPGQGVMFGNAGVADYTITFVGEVMQGTNLDIPLINGVNIVSSIVPQAGRLVADLGYPVQDQDTILVWNQAVQAWTQYLYDITFGSGWDPGEPSFKVGDAIVITSSSAKHWTRSFSIN